MFWNAGSHSCFRSFIIFYLHNIQSNDGRSEIRSTYFTVGKQSVVEQQLEYVLPGSEMAYFLTFCVLISAADRCHGTADQYHAKTDLILALSLPGIDVLTCIEHHVYL